jgi:hypothetical protein
MMIASFLVVILNAVKDPVIEVLYVERDSSLVLLRK